LIYAIDSSRIGVIGPGKIVGNPALGGRPNPTFALRGHFLSEHQKIPFAFNVGTAKIGENRLGEDLASFLGYPSLACCC
jgi:hypothetical protein